MSLTVVNNNYVGEVLTEIANIVYFGSKDWSLFDLKTGIVGSKVRFRFASVTTAVEAFDSICEIEDNSDSSVEIVDLRLKKFFVQQSICNDKLWETDFADVGDHYEDQEVDPVLVEEWIREHAANASLAMEKARWSGDTTRTDVTAKDVRKHIDGVVKLVKAKSPYDQSTNPDGYRRANSTVVTVTAANVIDEIKKVYLALPLEVRKSQGFKILISPEVGDLLETAVGNNNYQSGKTSLPVIDWDAETGQLTNGNYFGAPVFVVNGLSDNGNENIIMAGIFTNSRKGIAKLACIEPENEKVVRVKQVADGDKVRLRILSAQTVGIIPNVSQVAMNA